jgi:hypothetical protein
MQAVRTPDPAVIIGRGALAGLHVGTVSGLLAGTVVLPIWGTIVGLVIGAGLGLIFGLVNGMVLAGVAITCRTRSRLAHAAIAAVTSGLCATAAMVVVAGGGRDLPDVWLGTLAFVSWCGVTGALFGPVVADASRPNWVSEPDCGMTRMGAFALRAAALVCSCVGLVGLWAMRDDWFAAAGPVLVAVGLAAVPGALIGAALARIHVRCTSRVAS